MQALPHILPCAFDANTSQDDQGGAPHRAGQNYHKLCRERVRPMLKKQGWQDAAYKWLGMETELVE